MPDNNNSSKMDFSTFSNIINGQFRDTPATRHGVNPSTREALPPSPVSTQADVNEAVHAARKVFQEWKKTPIEARKEKLKGLAVKVILHKEEFARLLIAEHGKPTQFAYDEIIRGAHWFTGTCQLDMPVDEVENNPERRIITRYVPLGVVVGIVPWNYPIMLLCGKLGPALMAVNCIIVKPSPFTPYCGIKIVELAQRFFPPGVVQVLSGGDDLGPMLTTHPSIDKISFTGSTATGKKVMESASKNLTRVTLDFGGNDAAIVCSDADVESAASQIAIAAFMNAGQICIAVKRIYVHRDIYDSFKACFMKHLSQLKVGDGFAEGTFMGPVQNELQFERVKAHLEDVTKNNYVVLKGGNMSETLQDGFFIQPTVVDNPPDDSKIVREEPFGPVVPLLKWSGVDEVLSRVNANDMGLGASVWTADDDLGQRIAEGLDVGSVWFNEHLVIEPTAVFGGHKKSGIGCEWGVDGLRGYCNSKTFFYSQLSRLNMSHDMVLNLRDAELLGAAFASGCVLHILFYRRGEWDLIVPRILQIYTALPVIVIGMLHFAGAKGWLNNAKFSVTSVLLLETAHIVGVFSSIFVYRTLFDPLNRFPGPFGARISNFYVTYLSAKNLHLFEEMERLHEKHGDFVRLGQASGTFEALYSARSPCTKDPFYNVLHPRVSLHMIREHKEHSNRRKVWDRAFSSKSLQDYEPRITKYTTQLLDRLHEMQGMDINASDWLNFHSFDVMGDLAFGKSFDMLRSGVKHYFMTALHDSMKMVGYLSHITWMLPVFKLIPANDQRYSLSIDDTDDEQLKPDSPDVFSWILEEYECNLKTKQAKLNLDAEAYLIAVAGSDTTAATLTSIFFELASSSSEIAKLRDEVDKYFSERDHADSISLSTLTHINAIIDESLRLRPPVPSGLQRVTPPQGLLIGDTMVPENTIVQVPMHTFQRDERHFMRPLELIPDRWTTCPELTKNGTVLAPFSIGRYSYVGKQLGLMEVRYVVAHVIRAFDINLADGQTKEGFSTIQDGHVYTCHSRTPPDL
ncbi:hypothetical protein F53441_12683 [Fusarium austroafricanum]|uniref:aldehyde dehydrogenase (NAD(+)) n=1 Tax=Fusarium austroafricanum TaxID=2364996 RepID=A0A8H4JWR7_9HYPO|nr:hypothetical protein F53441_12683 [Fusarium austroafricanum]